MLELRPRGIDIHGLRLGLVELGLRLRYFDAGGNASVIAIPREVQSLLIGDDRIVQDSLLRIQAARFKVIGRQLGLELQLDVLEVGGGGLVLLGGARNAAANASPKTARRYLASRPIAAEKSSENAAKLTLRPAPLSRPRATECSADCGRTPDRTPPASRDALPISSA